jgi:GAF domain-containing protein
MLTQSQVLTQLQDIGSTFYAQRCTRDEARAAVLDVVLTQLGCSRVSLWRFDDIEGDISLMCFASKRPGSALDLTQSRLMQAEYEDYFDELVKTSLYVSDNAQTDSRLQAMRIHYLMPNNVQALLDCAFSFNGRAYGMVCCEQADAPRHWHVDEVGMLRAIVAKLSMLMVSAADPVLWSTPSLSMEPVSQGNSRPGRLESRLDDSI